MHRILRRASNALSILAGILTLPLLACGPGVQGSADDRRIGERAAAGDDMVQPPLRIVVDISERKLYEYRDGELANTFPVAVGMAEYPTPTGTFRIHQVDWNPEWHPPDDEWAEGETPKGPGEAGNPMGRVKMIFSPPYTIHGTRAYGSLGKAASHGSIRLGNENAVNLARRVMEHGGAQRSDAWYAEVEQSPHDLRQVGIPNPIPLDVRP